MIGKYCEKREPSLAFIGYTNGYCDNELIAITNENSVFKQQMRSLVKRCRLELRAHVLSPSNDHRRQLIDQVNIADHVHYIVPFTDALFVIDHRHCPPRVD